MCLSELEAARAHEKTVLVRRRFEKRVRVYAAAIGVSSVRGMSLASREGDDSWDDALTHVRARVGFCDRDDAPPADAGHGIGEILEIGKARTPSVSENRRRVDVERSTG